MSQEGITIMKRRVYTRPLLLLAAAAIAGIPAAAGSVSLCDTLPVNLVKNCGFEANLGAFPNAWTADAGYNLNAGGFNQVVQDPHSGSNNLQFGNLDAQGPAGISQDITDVLGGSYTVDFFVQWGFVSNTTNADAGAFVKALLNGTTEVTIDQADSPPPANAYGQYSFSFTGSGLDTLKFEAQTNPSEWFLDDISVVGPVPSGAAPEPASWALIGLGAVGMLARRRWSRR
jgi:hypothetical protein